MSRFGFYSRYDSSSSPGIPANQSSGSSGSGMNFWQKLWKWLSGGYYAEHNNGFLAFVKQVGGYATDEEARAALSSEHSDTFMSRFFGNPLGAVSEEVSNIFGENGPLSGLGNLISSLASRIAGTNLTGAEREANEFTAQQAQINRTFQSAEADKARQWQEDQYLRYNSPGALMRQYSEAGINPMMVAGGNMPSASTSTASPSGNAGSSVSPSAPIDIISSIISVLKAKAEIQNIKADTNAKDAAAAASKARADRDVEGTRGDKILNDVNEEFASLTAGATYDKIIQEIDVLTEQGNTARYERQVLGPLREAVLKAQDKNLSAEAAIDEWRKKYIDLYGSDPSGSVPTQVLTTLGTLIDRIFKRIRGGR